MRRWPALCGGRHQSSQFKNGNHGKNANEEENQRQKQTNGSKVSGPVPDRGVVHIPGRGKVIAVQAGNDNDESFQPHSHVHDDRDYEKDDGIVAVFLDPEELRGQDIANHQTPEQRSVRPFHTV